MKKISGKYWLSSLAFGIVLLLIGACKQQEQRELSPCEMYDILLNGVFEAEDVEGSLTFIGGMSGTVEFQGADFNDVVCNYSIIDCMTGDADMNCQGSPHKDVFKIVSPNQFRLGARVYTKVEEN